MYLGFLGAEISEFGDISCFMAVWQQMPIAQRFEGDFYCLVLPNLLVYITSSSKKLIDRWTPSIYLIYSRSFDIANELGNFSCQGDETFISFHNKYIYMADAETVEELAHAAYWNQRYSSSSDSSYEWFKSFASLKPFLSKHLPDPSTWVNGTDPRILHLGCGNSVCAFIVATVCRGIAH